MTRLSRIRHQLRLTQTAAARLLGITQQTYQRRERRGERDARDAAQPGFPWYLLHDRHLGTNLCDRRDGYSRQKYFGKAREGLDFALYFCIIVELMVSP